MAGGEDRVQRCGPERRPAQRSTSAKGLTHTVVELRRNATSGLRSDKPVRHQAGTFAVADEVVAREEVEHFLKGLEHKAIGVDPEAAVSPEKECADVVRPVWCVEAGEIDVTVPVAQKVEAFGVKNAQPWSMLRDGTAARANPRGTWSLPIGPNGKTVRRGGVFACVGLSQNSCCRGGRRELLDELRRLPDCGHAPQQIDVRRVVRIEVAWLPLSDRKR